MAKKKYTDAALLVGSGSAGQKFCQICFWLWGIVGLIYLFPGLPGLPGSGGSPVPLLYWIGGMLLFGAGGCWKDHITISSGSLSPSSFQTV